MDLMAKLKSRAEGLGALTQGKVVEWLDDYKRASGPSGSRSGTSASRWV